MLRARCGCRAPTLASRGATRRAQPTPPTARASARSQQQRAQNATATSRRQLLALVPPALLGADLALGRATRAEEEQQYVDAAAAAAADPTPDAAPPSPAADAADSTAAAVSDSATAAAPEQPAAEPAPAPAPPPAQAANATGRQLTADEKLLLEQNARMRSLNRAPADFPAFIRKGFNVTILADGYVYEDNGLIYKEFEVGSGPTPSDGQLVVFNYIAYNESGALVDSTYRQGRPAETRVGINGMIPGFEVGIKQMRPGSKRRLIVPPDLGPPIGPATFFSAKQYEVFDVELEIKSCERKTVGMFSNVVCQ